MTLIAICVAALAGLAVGDLLPLDAARLLTAAGVSALGAALAWRKPAWRLLALATCAAAVGAARASSVAADGAGPTAMIGSLAAPLAEVRTAMESGVRRYLPEPQASLALGVLLGGSGHLDATMRLDLQRSGLAHLVAIDGLKQVLVAAALGVLSARLIGPSLGALPTLVGIAGYTLLTGAHPSAVRAGLMVGLATLASLTGRLADSLTSLLLAVTLMATMQPRVLLDVGLQLSLSATLGIVLLWPRLRRRLHRLPRCIAEPVGLTLAVTLATLPVMLSTFQVV
ncbi:MAG TPA: ComEC/Rec2 family competence protein, partial [Chloroflexota bacterium]|nr:ComEC/Rec2 family competence protein [Chloroflexota bacterium]